MTSGLFTNFEKSTLICRASSKDHKKYLEWVVSQFTHYLLIFKTRYWNGPNAYFLNSLTMCSPFVLPTCLNAAKLVGYEEFARAPYFLK